MAAVGCLPADRMSVGRSVRLVLARDESIRYCKQTTKTEIVCRVVLVALCIFAACATVIFFVPGGLPFIASPLLVKTIMVSLVASAAFAALVDAGVHTHLGLRRIWDLEVLRKLGSCCLLLPNEEKRKSRIIARVEVLKRACAIKEVKEIVKKGIQAAKNDKEKFEEEKDRVAREEVAQDKLKVKQDELTLSVNKKEAMDLMTSFADEIKCAGCKYNQIEREGNPAEVESAKVLKTEIDGYCTEFFRIYTELKLCVNVDRAKSVLVELKRIVSCFEVRRDGLIKIISDHNRAAERVVPSLL